MNMYKKLSLVGVLVLMVGACTVKEYKPDDYQHYTAKQIYQKGIQALAKNNYRDAIKYFEAIDALYPYDPEAQQGQLKVIDAYYQTEDYASALASANRYIHLHPEGEYTDYVFYMKGLVNFSKDRSVLHKIYPRKPEKLDISNLRDAFEDFDELVKKFPHSSYIKDAKQKMQYIRNLLIEHDLNIAKFYYERKAYIAAINRANNIVKNFEDACQVKEALKITIQAYQALGMDERAEEARRILRLKFPKESV